jgi:hypothetical protein
MLDKQGAPCAPGAPKNAIWSRCYVWCSTPHIYICGVEHHTHLWDVTSQKMASSRRPVSHASNGISSIPGTLAQQYKCQHGSDPGFVAAVLRTQDPPEQRNAEQGGRGG